MYCCLLIFFFFVYSPLPFRCDNTLFHFMVGRSENISLWGLIKSINPHSSISVSIYLSVSHLHFCLLISISIQPSINHHACLMYVFDLTDVFMVLTGIWCNLCQRFINTSGGLLSQRLSQCTEWHSRGSSWLRRNKCNRQTEAWGALCHRQAPAIQCSSDGECLSL